MLTSLKKTFDDRWFVKDHVKSFCHSLRWPSSWSGNGSRRTPREFAQDWWFLKKCGSALWSYCRKRSLSCVNSLNHSNFLGTSDLMTSTICRSNVWMMSFACELRIWIKFLIISFSWIPYLMSFWRFSTRSSTCGRSAMMAQMINPKDKHFAAAAFIWFVNLLTAPGTSSWSARVYSLIWLKVVFNYVVVKFFGIHLLIIII